MPLQQPAERPLTAAAKPVAQAAVLSALQASQTVAPPRRPLASRKQVPRTKQARRRMRALPTHIPTRTCSPPWSAAGASDGAGTAPGNAADSAARRRPAAPPAEAVGADAELSSSMYRDVTQGDAAAAAVAADASESVGLPTGVPLRVWRRAAPRLFVRRASTVVRTARVAPWGCGPRGCHHDSHGFPRAGTDAPLPSVGRWAERFNVAESEAGGVK